MTALVTGAAGFIGSHLVRALRREGTPVQAIVRPGGSRQRLTGLDEVPRHEVDVTDAAAVAAAIARVAPDVVYHLACPGGHPRDAVDRVLLLRGSVEGTANLLEALPAGVRLVHVGSSLEYGPSHGPLREDHPLRPSTFRGACRAAASVLVRQRAEAEGRPFVILRLFSIFGPWEPARRLVPTAVRAALTGETMPLARGFPRDFVYVEDAVEACLLAARVKGLEPGEALNVGGGVERTNEELVAAVEAVTGRRIRVREEPVPRPSDTVHWRADPSRVTQRLGWRPRHDLEQGLRWTVDWWQQHPDGT